LHGCSRRAPACDTLSLALQPRVYVFALDPPGHGDSDPADVYIAVVAFDDLAAVIDQLDLRSPILIGLSMGGRNAMYFTAKRRDDVARLVIVDIGPEISARASAPSSGPPEPDTWEGIEQAARHLLHANPYLGIHSYRWVGSKILRKRTDGAPVSMRHPSVKRYPT